MKKIYLIGTIIGLSIITMFTSLSVFAIDVNSNEYYVYSDRAGSIDEYYIPYDTKYIYYKTIGWDDGDYIGFNLNWYDNNDNFLFSDDMEFYGPNFNEKHQLTFMFPLIYSNGIPDIGYINDIIQDKYLYTKTFIEYNVNDGFTITFNNGGSSDSIPLIDGHQFTSDNYYIISQQLFYDTAYQQGFNVGYQQGFSDGLGDSYQYDKGFNDGYEQGYDIGYDAGLTTGQTMGFNQARDFYGYYDGTQWLTVQAWGDIQYNQGVSANINVWSVLGLTFFNSVSAIGNIEVLPGLKLWFLVAFPLIIGIIKFIAGGDTNNAKNTRKGGKK